MSITIIEADLDRADHAAAVVTLTNAYAMDPMGLGQSLPDDVLRELVPGLKRIPTRVTLLAYDGERPVGIATCFLGFSTFVARPLVNLHDLAVIPEYRGQNVSRQLLEAVEAKARVLGCCKVTLEVQEANRRAKAIYERAGYVSVKRHDTDGDTFFLAKPV